MNSWIQYLWVPGAVAVVAVALQSLWLTFDVVRRRSFESRQRRLQTTLLEQRVRTARHARQAKEEESLHWAGWRKFEVIEKKIEDANQEVASFCLAPHDGKPIPGFKPGQFLTFQLDVPGQTKPVVRCYSLSDSPREGHYRVTIKKAPPPGVASGHFLEQVQVGDILDVRAPAGHFFLDMSKPKPVVLLGGGVGITPVLSMANAIAETPGMRETWFFFGVRNEKDAFFVEHLEAFDRAHPNIHVRVCYSKLKEDQLPPGECHVTGRVSVDLVKRHLMPEGEDGSPSGGNNYDYLFCGPKPMMDSLCEDLAAWGVPGDCIHFEDFGPAAGKVELDPSAGTGPEITFKKSDKVFNWNSSAKSLSQLAQANDIDSINVMCGIGNCGSCMTAIRTGKVKYDEKPDFPFENGTCLACCCKPDGPVELDA